MRGIRKNREKKKKPRWVREEIYAEKKLGRCQKQKTLIKFYQKDLLKKLYQVDTTLTRERGGSGLGLAICRGIIDNHGGSISVQSQEGKGAKFTFSIPRQAIALA